MTARETLLMVAAMAILTALAPALLHGAAWVLAVYAALLGGL